jgi:hypothetical protein
VRVRMHMRARVRTHGLLDCRGESGFHLFARIVAMTLTHAMCPTSLTVERLHDVGRLLSSGLRRSSPPPFAAAVLHPIHRHRPRSGR